MTRDIFEQLRIDPWYIGFDDLMDRAKREKPAGYPPYNLLKSGDNTYLLEMAVAGFGEDDISITLDDGNLIIDGKTSSGDMPYDFIHQGIAARNFTSKFMVADTVEVRSATMEQGMLRINLENVIPEEKKPKNIPINKAGDKQLLQE